MPQQDPSRTESATTKRRNKARNEGNVPKSQELPKVAVLLAGFVAVKLYLEYVGRDLMGLMRWFIRESFHFTPDPANVQELLEMSMLRVAVMIGPILLVVGVAAFACQRLQVGKLWTTKVFKFDLSKHFNIAAGLKRLFVDVQTLIRLGKSIAQASAIGFAVYFVLEDEIPNILPLYYQNVYGVAQYMLQTAGQVMIWVLTPMTAVAAFDLWYTRWDYEENLKMTKDEVKDERKQAEGDQQIKMKQKQKMMAVMARRMMQDVKKSSPTPPTLRWPCSTTPWSRRLRWCWPREPTASP